MKKFKKYLFVIPLLLFVAGFVAEDILLNNRQEEVVVHEFELKLQEKQALLNDKLDEIVSTLDEGQFDNDYLSVFHYLIPLFENQGIGFLILENDNMVFWSDNRFSFSEPYLSELHEETLQYIANGVYLNSVRNTGNYTVIGLISIKNNYSIENQFMKNGFSDQFNIPDNYTIDKNLSEGSLPVYDVSGKYLFSLSSGGTIYCQSSKLLLPFFFFALGILFLLYWLRILFIKLKDWNFLVRIILLGIILVAIYSLRIFLGIPRFCSAFELFSPNLYAYSSLLPSLGDLFLLSVLIFFWSLNFSRGLRFSKEKQRKEIVAAYSFLTLFYLFINLLIRNLIRNSSFSFQLNNIDDINVYSLVGYLVIGLLIYSVFIVNLSIVELSRYHIHVKKFLRGHLFLIILLIITSIVFKDTFLYILCLFLFVNYSIIRLQNLQLGRFSLNFMIFFVSLFSFFSLIIIQNHNNAKQKNLKELMAITLNSEQDPAAVVYLNEIQQQIDNDVRIQELLYPPYIDLEQYIRFQYFSGYFRDYDLLITTCGSSDSLLVQPDNKVVACFPFFDEMIETSGTQIPGTDFYHLDNNNGRVSYLGKLFYPLTSDSTGVSIFLDLESKLQSEGEGFPELLIDNSIKKPDSYQHFSYAKYYDSNLVHMSGDYEYYYDFNSYHFDVGSSEFTYVSRDGYDHLIYSLGDNNYIVVSGQSFTIWDYLISFPYIFVFFLIFSLFLVLATNSQYRKQAFVFDLRFRIQLSIVAVVLIALLIVAGGTVFYNMRNYNSWYEDDLNEKMKSVSEEININLNDLDAITPDVQNWLWEKLIELSNVFSTDINIYDLDGELLASSRPEVFTREIISDRMDPNALYELTEFLQVNFTQPEKIGSLSYLSIYEPIINYRGEYIGYINLPYFSHQDEMRQEISTFIVAFINLYALLFFISVVIAVILSNKITRPLSILREKIKGIQLNRQNEQISYQRDDEIGELIKEYNRKVEELADSAEMLAQNEREMAWREMAQQVAHEIKNPLTPMKLNIQFLQRKKAEKSEEFDEFFERATRALIEQIDTLSSIATEFSNFANIPNARNEAINLVERLESVAELFNSGRKLNFELELNNNKEVFVLADQEQLSRVFMNLIKNAIQSVPPKREVKITVSLHVHDDKARVLIMDNGAGIPDNIRPHLFQPNFTTKSSGMGLGLAIVKKIIENFKGSIWFETEINKGTTFYVEFPLYKKEK